jgi:hypothetical protein
MSFQFSVAARNAWLDAIETAIGASAILKIRTGAVPATCATADAGTVLATMALPSDWMAAASAGAKALAGTWQDTAADATGTAAHFRIYASDGVTCHMQGTVSQSAANGGTGDLKLAQATADLVAGVQVTISAFTLTANGA